MCVLLDEAVRLAVCSDRRPSGKRFGKVGVVHPSKQGVEAFHFSRCAAIVPGKVEIRPTDAKDDCNKVGEVDGNDSYSANKLTISHTKMPGDLP